MDDTAVKIAGALAQRALDGKGVTTYQMLGRDIGWHHPTGRGLGRELEKVLSFCSDRQLPILTSIVCNTGTRTPSDDGLGHMRRYYGDFDLDEEQRKVFDFDWTSVPEFGLVKAQPSDVDFTRLYGTRVYGFPENSWAMLGFGREGDRDGALEKMAGKPVYVAYFCPNNQRGNDTGDKAMEWSDVGRVLGIVELQPVAVTPDTHVEPETLENDRKSWNGDKWPFGIEISRAWQFLEPPFAADALPETSKRSWPPTNSIVDLTRTERAALAQYSLEEVPVYRQPEAQVNLIQSKQSDPAVYTYLMICRNRKPLKLTSAPDGTFLAKIGVTNDPDRRLLEISGNHIATLFGLEFETHATKRWPTQEKALEVEAIAHEWGHRNTHHASGEYFYMTEEQYRNARAIVMLGKPAR